MWLAEEAVVVLDMEVGSMVAEEVAVMAGALAGDMPV